MARQDPLLNVLKEKGYKLTRQRKAVIKAIVSGEKEHLSVEEIHKIAKKLEPRIGFATVYRTVTLLQDLNVLQRVDWDSERSRYELVSDQAHYHHHLICVKCGKVEEVNEDLLDELESKIESRNKFKVINHVLIFYGLCEECRKSQQDQPLTH